MADKMGVTSLQALDVLKRNILEDRYPMFSDDELEYYLERNNGDIDQTSYECLILKAENTGLTVSGLTTKDSSSYFKMIASHFVKTNSGVLS